VSAGETIRCWMPYPSETGYQCEIRLLEASPPPISLASNNAPHRSLYFEQKVQANAPTVFEATYEYTAKPRYERIDPHRVVEYVPKEAAAFLKEQPPHVRFLSELAELAKSIVGEEDRPYYKARRIYDWICEHTHYRYAREYSTISNISWYVYKNRFGDCGQLALLFMTLCRLQEIPARWESGWMIYPEGKNLHDWTLIYLHPYGWIPVDPNFGMSAGGDWQGLTGEERRRLRDFYFGCLSPYRLIFNLDHGRPHEPAKRHWRSDTVDFQRGELETEKENLYFDRFRYSLEILSDEPAG
ncbi:MAG: transglutaminase-like domain-containing protein, partial [Candidatus Hinthialibacter sp.]